MNGYGFKPKPHQKPLVRPRVGDPIDLPEAMLDDLARLFLIESIAVEGEAVEAYMRGQWHRGAQLELQSQGLEADSKEIAHHAFLRFRDRVHHEERNLTPWERRRRDRSR